MKPAPLPLPGNEAPAQRVDPEFGRLTGWAPILSACGLAHGEGSLYSDYRGAPAGWIRAMKGAISKNASHFNSHCMMRRYATGACIR